MRLLLAAALLPILALPGCPSEDCKEVQIPPFPQCPSGHWLVCVTKDGHPRVQCFPNPMPSASPSAEPSPVPTTTTTTTTSTTTTTVPPTPTPRPTLPPGGSCVADGVKIGFFASVPKWNDCKDCRGARNSFNVTPLLEGIAQGPETGCGSAFINRYGEFQSFIRVHGQKSGFEHQGCSLANFDPHECKVDDFYLYVDATNSDDDPDHWNGKTYLAGGARDYCVSWPQVAYWACISCVVDSRGAINGTSCTKFTEQK